MKSSATRPAKFTQKDRLGLMIACPLTQAKVGEAFCRDNTSILGTNRRVCANIKCASPWRLCEHCVSQGYTKSDARVVNPEKGPCGFHKEYGPEAIRRKISLGETLYADSEALKGFMEDPVSMDLGIGLNLPELFESGTRVLDIPCADISPSPEDQPRQHFDQLEMRRLSGSLKVVKQIQPIFVRRALPEDNCPTKWKIVDGERRWRSAVLAGKPTVKAVEVQIKDHDTQLIVASIANFCRAPHSELETGRAIERIIKASGGKINNEKIADMFGYTVSWAAQRRSIATKLDPEVQKRLDPDCPESERIQYSVALQLTGLSPDMQKRLAGIIVQKKMATGIAIRFINQEIKKADPADIGRKRKRKPVDDYRVFRRFVLKLEAEGELYLTDGGAHVKDMFTHRDYDDAAKMLASAKKGVAQLQKIISLLMEIKEQKD